MRLYPRLYHMAEDGSWPSIQQHGLLSTESLVTLFEVPADRREALLTMRRPNLVQISHPKLGTAVIRDQKPLSERKLEQCLTGVSVQDWLRLLNSKVFFWLQEVRLTRLLGAAAYRGVPHTVITVDTASLIAKYRSTIELSRINSGSTVYAAASRGSNTFLPISDYPHPPRKRPAAAGSDVAELAVDTGIPDISEYVVAVDRRVGPNIEEMIWRPAAH